MTKTTKPQGNFPTEASFAAGAAPGDNQAQQFRLQAAALESAANAILITDREGVILWANPAFTKLTGYTIEEILGRTPQILKSGKHDPDFYESMWRTLLAGGVWEGEIINRRKDGSLYVEEATITPVRSPDGGISHFIAVKENVTRRKQAEDSLRRVREANEAGLAELDAIVRSLNEGLVVADLNGNILRANPAALRIHGFTTEDEAHEHLTRYLELFEVTDLDGNSIPMEDWPLARAIRGEVFANVEIRVRRRDRSEPVTTSCSGAPVRDHNGKLIRAIITMRDVTELKQAEAVLRSRERQLIRAEKLASAGRMAATIAHEINNPLAAVVNAVFIAKTAQELPDQAKQALALAERELARVVHISKQTLGFYSEVTEPRPVHIAHILDEVLDLYSQKLKNKNISVQRRYNDAVASAVEGELRQIASNLITNSIDATKPNGTLWIRLSGPGHAEGQRRMIQITVADNGEGIAQENMKRIFEPFFTTKQSVGTGLGLWVTSELVKKHDGRIRIRSKLGKGTVIRVWLPTDRRRQDRRNT